MTSGSEILQLIDLGIGYHQSALVEGINTSAEAGQFILFLGANGKGKSTLLKTLVGQVRTMNGEILIHGQSIILKDLKAIARSISYVPGKLQLPNEVTVSDLLQYARIPYLKFMQKPSIEDQDIIDVVVKKLSIDQLVNCTYNEISDGQRQLVNIARSMVQQTPIILLDEPTANLDIVNKRMVFELLKEQAEEGKLIICCSHDLLEAYNYCSHLWIINQNGEFESFEKTDEVNLSEIEKRLFAS
ncbi:MAG: ABC transporter ATP-binding protein [Flavobacteriales bacterium]|nr:ABC transporter ATP-binding protein [Flavobacteriales bacterium]